MYITNRGLFRHLCLFEGYLFNWYLFKGYFFNIYIFKDYMFRLCLFGGYLGSISHFVASSRVSSFQVFSLFFPILGNYVL